MSSETNINNDCSICMSELIEDIIKLQCNHVFHIQCFDYWKKYNNSCPYCRYQIDQSVIPPTLYDELIHPDGNIIGLNEINFHQYFYLKPNTFSIEYVKCLINRVKKAKIFKDSLLIMENYKISGNYANCTGKLIKINQITYSGTFACHFIVNGIHKIFFNNLHNFELINNS